jgi:exopolysaccharide biosynthesis WecB/TagA/CpsF family protein
LVLSMPFKRISFLGLSIDVGGDASDLCGLLREKKSLQLVTFAGPEAWALAAKNPQYASDLERMSLVLPDGWGTTLAYRAMTQENCQPFGLHVPHFAKAFFETLVESKLTLGLVGGGPGAEDDIHGKLVLRYPGLKFGQTMHGFGDIAAKVATLMKKSPDVLIVGMQSPRKEAFLAALRDAGYKGVVFADSGFFDHFDLYPNVLAIDPCPAWVDQYNLRHLYQLYTKPQSLWRRYGVDYPLFLVAVAKTLAKTLIDELAEMRRKTV